MSEILQIFHQPPPSHQQMHTHVQRDVVNVESQFNWSMDSDFSSPGSYGLTDHSQCSEFVESYLTNFWISPVDELSKVTAIVEQNQSLKKRKLEVDVEEVDSRKQSVECDSELIEPPKAKRKTCSENSNPKKDCIHVRARRGQATDSHSLAERARRERIKKKMQFLQDLVPGCNKMTNKAAILDEIITYVQCLQSDVQILTMKLAALS